MDTLDCAQIYKSRGPVLCCDFTSDDTACSGGLDGDVKMYTQWILMTIRYDLMRMEDFVVGKHNDTVSCMRYAKSKSIFYLNILI